MLKGFGIKGYRSFGSIPQYLAPLSKINLIAGRNNTGKSNIIRALTTLDKYQQGLGQRSNPTPSNLDLHEGKNRTDFSWYFPISTSGSDFEEFLEKLVGKEYVEKHREILQAILLHLNHRPNNPAWIEISGKSDWKHNLPDAINVLNSINNGIDSPRVRRAWEFLWSHLMRKTGGSFQQHHGIEVLERIALQATQLDLPPVHVIGAHRSIGEPGSDYTGLEGQGIIAHLLRLQLPELKDRTTSLSKFNKINAFLSKVLEVDDARIEVPHSAKELNVNLHGKVLPIQSLGTGVHEVIILAAAATAIEKSILCIEEPELHLHPRLQRKLIQYLDEETTNQYFLTTHSSSLLDFSAASIFHASLNADNETEIVHLSNPTDRANICFDLGYRASDLVQANAIIWVEGPSDRIYLNTWIKAAAPFMIEGIHYSIMFYGGRLLSHLTTDDDSVKDFIKLLRLNRNSAIVMDSDKKSSEAEINATKRRIAEEFGRTNGFVWITSGREIENYIQPEAMLLAMREVHPSFDFALQKSEWSCSYKPKGREQSSVDKIALARALSNKTNLQVLDLEARLRGLIAFIEKANQ